MELTDLEKRCWAIVRGCRGAANAITRADLAGRLGVDDRRARRIVSGLVRRGLPVCGAYDWQAGGYFVPDSVEEASRVAGALRRHALKILDRARSVENWQLVDLAGQEHLFDTGRLPGEREKNR